MAALLPRRTFLKTTAVAATGLAMSKLGVGDALAGKLPFCGTPHAEKLGWRLGSQAYSFRKFSFFEAIEKNASLGLGYIEAYPGQRLSKEKPTANMNIDLSAPLRKEVKSRLDDTGVKMVNFGVCQLTKDENEARRTFDFAKEMGIETLVSEPPAGPFRTLVVGEDGKKTLVAQPKEEAFDTLEKLCDEYAINLAIHNHPKPSKYWDYRAVLAVCQGRSKRIGACCDTGHWMRSGIDPMEALKALQGRIISLHFKDLNKFGVRSAHDVPWGTGKGDPEAWLRELARQNFQGVFSIEYELANPELVQNIAKCVKYFDSVAAKLPAAEPA